MLRSRLLAPLLALAVVTPAAEAADVKLAPAAGTAAITAHGGQVILSRRDPATGRWALVRWRSGVVDVLPVAQRSVPFDADAGTDAAGDPVVVYSRCKREPEPVIGGGLAPSADWLTARGCDIHLLSLTGEARERKLVVAGSDARSETTPSMWRGGLAFGRHTDGGSTASLLYLPAGSKRTRRLGGGSVQACSGMCGPRAVHRGIEQLDIGPARAAFLWRMTGGMTYGIGPVWELRAASLKGGASTLLDSGLISGTCGFGLPSAPSARANPIAYLDAGGDCDETATQFATVDAVTGARGVAPTPGGLAAGAARDGDTIYWLRVTGPATDVPVPGASSCGVATARCELVASPAPDYAPQPSRRQGSPAEVDLVRSAIGYRWVRGPLGTRLLRPPASVPCAPSTQAAAVFTGAQWRGRRSVRVLRSDRAGASRQVGVTLRRGTTLGSGGLTRVLRCGDRLRLTYVVTEGRTSQRVSFSVVRAPAKRR